MKVDRVPCWLIGHRWITRLKPESSIKKFCGRCMKTIYKLTPLHDSEGVKT